MVVYRQGLGVLADRVSSFFSQPPEKGSISFSGAGLASLCVLHLPLDLYTARSDTEGFP